MQNNPYESPDATGEQAAPKKSKLGRRIWQGIMVLGVIGLVIALLLPSVRSARPAARRMQCGSNLKQIGLALHNYHDQYQALPPAYTVDAEGQPLHSWRTLILPYLQQKQLYEEIDLTKAWDDPANQHAHQQIVVVYECPSFEAPAGHTLYQVVVAPGSCFPPAESRTLEEVPDTNSTLMVVEVGFNQSVHWMAPTDADLPSILHRGQSKNLPHQGTQGVLASGRTLFLSEDMPAETIRAMVSIVEE